jgi:hypothetical protein
LPRWLESIVIERREPDLRVTPMEPLPDVFDWLTYAE